MDMNQEKITQLFENDEFLNKLADMNSAEEAQALFDEYGIELPLQDVESIGSIMGKVAGGEISMDMVEKAANGELSEEELEQVAGGEMFTLCGILFMTFLGTCAAGGGVTGVLAAVKRWRW